MKRILICITLLLTSLFFFAQSKQETLVIYIPYADTISQEMIDSIERQTGDYILSYHPKMRHLIPSMRCRRKPTPGRRIGVFSVAKDRQVSFAQGNLQYVQSEMQWQFANQQYEYIGANNVNNLSLQKRKCRLDWRHFL